MLLQTFGVNQPNRVAACQMLAICGGVYQNDRVNIERLLGDDGEIIFWYHIDDSWPPSLIIIRTTEGHYFVVLEGTTNLRQASLHLLGSFILRDVPRIGSVQGAWWIAMQQYRAAIIENLPLNLPSGKLHLSGHSYGGAIAFLAALWYRNYQNAEDIEVLTFGEPKSCTAKTLFLSPACHWRYASNHDPVTLIPPDIPVWTTKDILIDSWFEDDSVQWKHHGDPQLLFPGGTINTPEPVPDPLPAGVVVDTIEEHLLRNYWGRLQAWNERFGV